MNEDFWKTQIRGYEKYTKADMKASATFWSDAKFRKIFLLPPEEEKSPMGQIRKKPQTGLRVNFTNGVLYVRNKAVLKMLLEHRALGNANGFHIHNEDPTGFWRTQGVVETAQIHVVKDVNRGVKFDDLDLTAAILGKINPDEITRVHDLKIG